MSVVTRNEMIAAGRFAATFTKRNGETRSGIFTASADDQNFGEQSAVVTVIDEDLKEYRSIDVTRVTDFAALAAA